MNVIKKTRIKFASVVILALLAGIVSYPRSIKFIPPVYNAIDKLKINLGLDLQGGIHLEYKADLSKIDSSKIEESMQAVQDVIERRVNAFGIAEPVVQTTKAGESWRVIVELAGVHDINQAIKMIGETPLLEFKEQNSNPTVQLTDQQKSDLEKYNKEAKARAEKILTEILKPNANFGDLAKQYSEDPGSKDNGGDIGFFKKGGLVEAFENVCFNQLQVGQTSNKLTETAYGWHIIRKEEQKGEGDNLEVRCQHILIMKKSENDFAPAAEEWLYTGLSGKQLQKASVIFDPNTQAAQVSLQFNDEGKDLFAQITKRNIGKPVAIFLDGTSISVPTVQDEITGGSAVITGKFTIQEAKLLSQRLNSGALPVPIKLISQQTIGASLGNKAVQDSLRAGLFGLLAVALFMILYYRLPGLVSVLALCLYGLVVLAIFKIISATLSLAGIAGFILSLGMAVDANVLIFERLKEELRKGKPLSIAMEEGFKRAMPSILASNISSILTCMILLGFTTSLVKGFAITLTIGILVSMFSAIVVTRTILLSIMNFKAFSNTWLFGVKKARINSN